MTARRPTLLLLAVLLALLAGCATPPGRAPWGSTVDWTPGWPRLGRAALDAAADPLTWAPAAGAALFAIGDWDEDLSDWARDHAPLFDDRAGDASDLLRDGLVVAYLGTALATDGELSGERWLAAKANGLGVGLATGLTTGALTYGLKDATARTRPDRSDDGSFPSAHSSATAALATLIARNGEHLPLSAPQRTLVKGGGYALAAATAWARLESGSHYPSDVLAGLALGHYVSALLQEGLMAQDDRALALNLELGRERLLVGLRLDF